MKKNSVKCKELAPSARISGFNEVVLGYTEEEALLEAARCIKCKNPTCVSGCPVGIDIKKFISQITEKDYKGAYFTIKEKNNFPSMCGRVCPAEYQCRKTCVLTKKGSGFATDKAINIHFLERFIGDWGMKHGLGLTGSSQSTATGNQLKDKKVAIVGSGPAGLCCAGELARFGIKVVIFEGLHRPGGVLAYGIPTFRLPVGVLDYEINYLNKMGVKIKTNIIVGKTKTMDELFDEGFSCIFLGLGAGTPTFLGVRGENLCNVYSANEFLTRVNLMEAYKFPRSHTPVNIGNNIAVIGGGNTAMDAARVAIRLQKMNNVKANVTLLYRRTENEMPARRLEIMHAKEEGVKFEFLVQPVEFMGNKEGYIKKIKALRCELGEPDSSGRRRPIPIKASEFDIASDIVIVAVGLKANSLLTKETPALNVDKYGDITADPDTMATSMKKVYAGGDIVGGEGTIIEAMGMAKTASAAIIKYLSEKGK